MFISNWLIFDVKVEGESFISGLGCAWCQQPEITAGIEDSTNPILILDGSLVLMGKCGETHHGSMICLDDFCEAMFS